jgi:hypothetical protein
MENYECRMLNEEEECSVFRVQCSARKERGAGDKRGKGAKVGRTRD